MLNKEAQQEFDELMGLAAHDLVEPVRKIEVFGSRLQQILQDKNETEALVFLDKILSHADSINHLVHQLHTYSRIHRKAESAQAVDLNFIVKTIIQENDGLKKLNLNLQQLPVICMSFAHSKEMFYQLFDNAKRFAKNEHDIQLTVEYGRVNYQGTPMILLSFTDNGIGIDQADRKKVLHPFVRLHPRHTYGGAGLGLSIVQQIVLHYHGIVLIEDVENGTTINIYLPQSILAE